MAEDRMITAEEQEFTGAILTGMFNQSAATANALDDMRLAEIERWKERFTLLYNSMEKVAQRTDSNTAYDALSRFSYEAELAEKGKEAY